MSERIFTVLTIDGGGVRGVITARLLQEIEERTGKPIAKLFDLIAGSSTGAILAGSLTVPDEKNPEKPRYSAEDMKKFYLDFSAKIFPPSRNRQLKHLMPGLSGFFNPAPFEKILEDQLGDATMGDSLTHLMIAGTDMKKFRPVWMSNFKELGKRPDLPHKWESLKLRDAIRASASAPTVFPAKYIYTQPNKNNPQAHERHAFLDGSLFASTVGRRAYTRAKKLAPKGARVVVVSLGTGAIEPNLTPDEINKLSPFDWINSDKGTSVFSVAAEMTIRDIINDLREELGEDLFRLDALIDPDEPDAPSMSLTNAKEENMQRLLKAADKMIDMHDERIDELCQVLLARHHMEQQFALSTDAFNALSDQLSDCNSSKKLNRLYGLINQYSSNLKESAVPSDDRPLYQACQKLSPAHREQLGEIYEVKHEALVEEEVKIQKSGGIKSWFNFLRRNPKDTPADRPGNDNDNSQPNRNQNSPKP